MKRKAPTAEQKRWHDWLAQLPCPVTDGPCHLHHCVGASAKSGGVNIGQWFVINLSPDAHDGPHGIHKDRELFRSMGIGLRRLDIEKSLFASNVNKYQALHGRLPMPDVVFDMIMAYTR